MQAVAAEVNLSETAFVEHADGEGVRRLRWFTPTVEVPLCGHATLAAGHVLRSSGTSGPHRFSTASGLLTVHDEPDAAFRLDFPVDVCAHVEPRGDLLEALGVRDEDVSEALLGSINYILRVSSPSIVEALEPNFPKLGRIELGRDVLVLSVTSESPLPEEDVVSRVFAPWAGIDEDPVTGIAHTALGPYWIGELGRPEIRARQGGQRQGELRVRLVGDRVHLIGHAVTVARGVLTLPVAASPAPRSG
jgi:PhzF family phenazine biosynthesis protein